MIADNQNNTMAPLVYYFPLSFATHKALLALEEKEIEYKLKELNILKGDNLSPEYLKINPKATVPALLADDGKIITDSNDILKYVDSQGERLGGSSLDSGTLHYWLKRLPEFDDNLYTFGVQGKGVAQLFNGFKIKVAEARAEKNEDLAQVYAQKIAVMAELIEKCGNAELIAAEEAKIRDICFVADNQLAQSHFLAGPKFSMADVAMITFLARLDMLKKTEEFVGPKEFLSKYWTECKTRASYKKIIAPTLGLKAQHIVLCTIINIKVRSLFKAY